MHRIFFKDTWVRFTLNFAMLTEKSLSAMRIEQEEEEDDEEKLVHRDESHAHA